MQGTQRSAIEEPVIKMLKPLASTMGSSIQARMDQKQSVKEKKLTKEQEHNMIQEGAFRRLLEDRDLATNYDERLSAAAHMWMKVKYSLSSGDSKLESKDGALIVEAID